MSKTNLRFYKELFFHGGVDRWMRTCPLRAPVLEMEREKKRTEKKLLRFSFIALLPSFLGEKGK